MSSFLSIRALLFVVLVFAAPTAPAQILLVIDDSNPSNVTFTATGNDSASTVVDDYLSGQINLLGFFTNDLNEAFSVSALSTTLAPAGGSLSYDLATNPTPIPIGSYDDLSLSSSAPGQGPTAFSSDFAAFSGTAAFDISDPMFASLLPLPGTTGTLGVISSEVETDTSIGQWTVISAPEPRSWILALAALVSFVALKARLRTV